jgi:hypothetical protein
MRRNKAKFRQTCAAMARRLSYRLWPYLMMTLAYGGLEMLVLKRWIQINSGVQNHGKTLVVISKQPSSSSTAANRMLWHAYAQLAHQLPAGSFRVNRVIEKPSGNSIVLATYCEKMSPTRARLYADMMLKANSSLSRDLTYDQLETTILPNRQCRVSPTAELSALDQFNSITRAFAIAGFTIAAMLISSVLYELDRSRPAVPQISTKNKSNLVS